VVACGWEGCGIVKGVVGGGDGGDRLKLLSPGQGDQALGSSPGPHTFNRGAQYVKGVGGVVGCGQLQHLEK
jgi:hypothetical protein